jgi:hypothetical protein
LSGSGFEAWDHFRIHVLGQAGEPVLSNYAMILYN